MFILYHFRSFAILSWFEIISQPDLAGGSPSLVSWKVAKTALVTDQLRPENQPAKVGLRISYNVFLVVLLWQYCKSLYCYHRET